MAVSSAEPVRESPTDHYPLLTEPGRSNVNNEHVIHVQRDSAASLSDLSDVDTTSRGFGTPNPPPGSSTQDTDAQSSSSTPHTTYSRNSSFGLRSDRMGRRRWSPLYSGFWVSIELIFTTIQIIAAVVVLYLSRDEKPRAPLFTWVIGYTVGCFVSIPIIYLRYLHRSSQVAEQTASHQPNQESSLQGNASPSDQNSYITISLGGQSPERDGHHHLHTSRPTNAQTLQVRNHRINVLVDNFKMALDCFFAVWFVVGNVWIFSGRSSASEAPNLYRLCIVYLTLSCIGYAMPFILCAMICCCLPCIISFLGMQEDQNQVQGASDECISALPTHKFKLNKEDSGSAAAGADDPERTEGGAGGVVAAGTEKERSISGEDAVCCICLATYIDNDELREMPCSHFFHSECVDKWLRINATCPLCKFELVSETSGNPPDSLPSNSNQPT